MRRMIILVALLLVGILVPTAAATPTVRSTLALGTPGSIGPRQDRYEAWPDAVTADNGWIVLAHASTDSHGFPTRRKAVVRVSKDKGKTWQVTKTFGTENMTGLEGMHRLANGRIVILLSDQNGHDDFNYIRAYKSDDDGLTWSALSSRVAWTNPWSYGNLERVTCDGGKLMIAWNNDTAWGIATSRDNGVTWTRTTNKAQHHLWEGRTIQVSGDKLLMIGRNDTGPNLFKSDDCGLTWTSESTGIPGRLSEGAVTHGDTLRMVTINRTNLRMEVRHASLVELYDDPTAWSAPKLLRQLKTPLSPVDVGYPQVLSISSTTDWVVWYGPASSTERVTSIYAASLLWP